MISSLLIAGLLWTQPDSTVRDVSVAPGEIIRTTTFGQGTPVMLVPGLFGSVYSWRRVIPLLTGRGCRVIVVEPLGTGASSHPPKADYSLTAQADRLALTLDSLGVRDAIVVAQSVSVSMVLRLALHHAELVRGIVAIDGGPIESAATPGLRRAMRWAPVLRLFVGMGTIRRKVRAGMIQNSADSTWITDTVVRGYLSGTTRASQAIDAFGGMARAREPEQLAGRLGEIRAQVRLLVGGTPHESATGSDEISQMSRGIQQFSVDTIPDAGQFIHEEAPRAVAWAVLEMVDGHDPQIAQ